MHGSRSLGVSLALPLPLGGQLGIGTKSASLLQATKCIKNLARIEAGRWESLGLEVLGTGSQSLGGQKIGKWWGQSWAQGWAKFWAQRDISMGIEQKRGLGLVWAQDRHR